jgi:hypothetical protein
VPHTQPAAAPLAANGKGLDQDIVERLTGGETLPEFDGLLAQLRILMYRAFDEPNKPVIERSMREPIPLKKPVAASQTRSNASVDIFQLPEQSASKCRSRAP